MAIDRNWGREPYGDQHRRFALGTGEHSPVPDPAAELQRDELAQVVHDLKNPLSSISLEAELLATRWSGTNATDLGRAASRILRNVTFLDRLVQDLLDACMMANTGLVLRRSACDLRALITAAIERIVPAGERHRVSLDAEELTSVHVDELRIERVIANLLDNALRYTPADSDIIVRLARKQRTAQLSVCDAGPGLSPVEMETIFEPYRRAASSAGRSGSGLGLYVSKQIVEAHGGHIGVESVRGWGTRFFFALPLA